MIGLQRSWGIMGNQTSHSFESESYHELSTYIHVIDLWFHVGKAMSWINF
jgi:hypothetical protein